ncbi:MAG: trypsin-like peptidase domain-containing protein [Burkholderiaceae bacterium]|nr:trypsin-like peptidase domain-containing protein [Burkholderiaceae bacterium]
MRKAWLIFSQSVTVAVALLFVVATLKPEWLYRTGADRARVVTLTAAQAPASASASASTSAAAADAPHSYRGAASRAAPAVVSVSASKAPTRGMQDPWSRFFFGDDGEAADPRRRQFGLGSGVIVSPEGYLLTNNHVIDGADDIEVQLADGREGRARVIGTDPDTDLAVLKIELDRLPVVSFGDTDALQVGDVVLAIGNPFGVGQTVTSGIVSALGRNRLGINTYENFIQTDAAINPGNSGGALIDANGNLLGINTAIFSRSGGNNGIGFAIPVSIARQVMEGLVRDGSVTRGWIGVESRDLTAEIAETVGLPIQHGALITGVLRDGPAGAGGVRPGDVVVAVADRPVANTSQLLNAVAALKPQSEASIGVQRGAQQMQLTIVVAQRPKAPARRER